MFYRHVILNSGGEEILYLYLGNYSSFINRLDNLEQDQDVIHSVYDYIKEHMISFHGNRVYIVVNDIIIGVLTLGKNKVTSNYQEVVTHPASSFVKPILFESKKEKKKEDIFVTLREADGKLKQMELDDYVFGVVASNMPINFEREALKSQIILSRTYALKRMMEDGFIRNSSLQYIYRDIDYLKMIWGNYFYRNLNRLKQIIKETNDEYLSFQNDYIEPLYHFLSNGKTESIKDLFGEEVPYLVSVDSKTDTTYPHFNESILKQITEVESALKIRLEPSTKIRILEKTDGNRVKRIRIGNHIFKGNTIRQALQLPSNDFTMQLLDNGEVLFHIHGHGHGLGMSQYGANEMAKRGYNYRQILSHYYPNTIIGMLD